MTLELLDDDSCCDDYDHPAAQRQFHQQQRQQRFSPDSAISVKVQSAQVHDVRAQQQKETETRAEENQSLLLLLASPNCPAQAVKQESDGVPCAKMESPLMKEEPPAKEEVEPEDID